MREFKLLTGERVVVMTDATALNGVVDFVSRSALTLRDVQAVDGPAPYPVDGLVIIPVSKINYVQVT